MNRNTSHHQSTFSYNRLKASFSNAFRGIFQGIKSEKNLQVHTLFAILVVLFAVIFKVTTLEWMLLLLCVGLVFSLELVNSAIEEVCDEACPDYSDKIKKAKDFSAGAVLFSAIIAATVGLIIFIPYLFRFLQL